MQIQSILSNGTGIFDQDRLLHQLPKDLSLAEKKVHRAVEEQAKDRKRTTLVQAISYLRQKKLDDTVKALNNLIACSKVSSKCNATSPCTIVLVDRTTDGTAYTYDTCARLASAVVAVLSVLSILHIQYSWFRLAHDRTGWRQSIAPVRT